MSSLQQDQTHPRHHWGVLHSKNIIHLRPQFPDFHHFYSWNFFHLKTKCHHLRLCKGLHKLKELIAQNLSAFPCGKRWGCVFELCCGFCLFMSERCGWRVFLWWGANHTWPIWRVCQQRTSLLRLLWLPGYLIGDFYLCYEVNHYSQLLGTLMNIISVKNTKTVFSSRRRFCVTLMLHFFDLWFVWKYQMLRHWWLEMSKFLVFCKGLIWDDRSHGFASYPCCYGSNQSILMELYSSELGHIHKHTSKKPYHAELFLLFLQFSLL